MNSILKLCISTCIFFLVSTDGVVGQDSITILNKSWQQLKIQLRKKAVVAVNMAKDIANPNKKEKDLIEKIKSTARDLVSFIDSSGSVDSLIVQITYEKDSKMTQALSKVLVMILEHPKSRSQEKLQQLQMQLEGIENKIHVARYDYNETCIQYKRPDLRFSISDPDKAPVIKF